MLYAMEQALCQFLMPTMFQRMLVLKMFSHVVHTSAMMVWIHTEITLCVTSA